MNEPHKLAEAFIRCQQHRDAAWKAHIGRKDRQALEHATLLLLSAKELQRALAEKATA